MAHERISWLEAEGRRITIQPNMIIDQRLKVERAKFVIDIIGLIFWIGLIVGIVVGVIMNKDVPKIALAATGVPLILLGVAIRDTLHHIRAKYIFIREKGVEMQNGTSSKWLAWNEVSKASEKRRFSGGLTLYNRAGESLLIPFVVEHYSEIRDYIISKLPKNA